MVGTEHRWAQPSTKARLTALLAAGWTAIAGLVASDAAAGMQKASSWAEDVIVGAESTVVARASVAVPAGTFCAAAMRDVKEGSSTVRSRYTLPADRPWFLMSVTSCSGAPCPPRTSAPAMLRYDGIARREFLLSAGTESALAPLIALGNRGAITDEMLQRGLAAVAATGGFVPALLPAPHAPSLQAKPVWTHKAHSGAATHVLVYPARGGACDFEPVRTALVFDYHLVSGRSRSAGYRPASGTPTEPGHSKEDELISSHVGRIQWLSSHDCTAALECLDHCTGLILDPPAGETRRYLLTARHCIFEKLKDPTQLDWEQRDLGSYVVDIAMNERSQARDEYLSLPVLSAGGSTTGLDYAFLELPPHPALAGERLPKATFSLAQLVEESNRNNLTFLSHPLGHTAQLSARCGSYAQRTNALFHTCFSLQGSSGGPLWWPEAVSGGAVAAGIHFERVRDCDTQSNPEWETYQDTDPTYGILQQRVLAGTCGDHCVGKGISVADIYCDHCTTRPDHPPCQALSQLLPVDVNLCKQSLGSTG